MPLKLIKRGEIWHYTGTVAGRRLRGSAKTSQKSEAERIANQIESQELQGRREECARSIGTPQANGAGNGSPHVHGWRM